MPQQPATPSNKPTSFDEDLAAVRSSFENDLRLAKSHVSTQTPVPHPVVARLLDWLPAALGAAGGVVGGIGGTVAGLGVGGVPGAIGGAALGGAAGESIKELTNNVLGNPAPASASDRAMAIAGEGAIQGGAEAVGLAAGGALKYVGTRLMRSALKPGVDLAASGMAKESIPPVVQTMLKEGVTVTRSGVQKLQRLITANADEIKALTDAAPGKIYPEAVADRTLDVVDKFANQVNPKDDLAAIAKSAQDFLDSRTPAGMRPSTPMSVAEAQKLKQGTYRVLDSKAYGEQASAATEAQKSLARGLKEEIQTQVPQVAALNAREGAQLEALNALARRLHVATNRDLGGIFWVAENPAAFLAAQFDRSPAVKSLLARGAYGAAGAVAHVSPQLLRFAVQAVASSRDDGGSQ